MSDAIVIVGAARTPMGSFQGDFATLAAHDLGAAAIRAAVERAAIAPALVDEVLLGNCLMAGQGQAPARQAALKAGLPVSAGAVTLSKICGSGMRSAMFGHDMLLAGSADGYARRFAVGWAHGPEATGVVLDSMSLYAPVGGTGAK